jgi:polysaccharide pyruvyl transferase WcaK-like protein
MKALFVGDNRTSPNWGRAASIALHQLLSGPFEIIGTVPGTLFDLSVADAGYVGTLLPARYYRLFRHAWLRRSRRPYSWHMKLEALFGARDFISDDPAVSVDNLLAHKDQHPALAHIYNQAREADCFIVDGDGDIIFSTPPRRQTLFLLAMIELGLRLAKPVFLVNSMLSDCPQTGRNAITVAAARKLFARCRAISLRDPESIAYARSHMPETSPVFLPDSLFAWYPRFQSAASLPPADGDFLLPFPEQEELFGKLDFSSPWICIGGGALAASQSDRAIPAYVRLVEAVRALGLRVYLTENDTPDAFLRKVAAETGAGLVPVDAPIFQCGAVLAHARLFISGRYHPSIFAALGGTPCIFLGSHAHKMRSISRLLEYGTHREFNGVPSESEIEEIVALSKSYISEGNSLRTRIKGVAEARYNEVAGLPLMLRRHLDANELEGSPLSGNLPLRPGTESRSAVEDVYQN